MTAAAQRGRLLAVDDSADSADLVARVAVKCGYEAQATSDPAAVRALVASWKPEVLTLDLCMPEADGIDLLSVLEESGFSGQLVIIGGLMREELTKANYKTPLLGDIPGVGKLFRSEQNQRSTIELVILLRPIVVADSDWPALISEPAARLQDLNKSGDFGPLDYPPAERPRPQP